MEELVLHLCSHNPRRVLILSELDESLLNCTEVSVPIEERLTVQGEETKGLSICKIEFPLLVFHHMDFFRPCFYILLVFHSFLLVK